MSEGADRIAKERRRQTDKLGWSRKHDNEHDDGSLAIAAACYAASAANLRIYEQNDFAAGLSFTDPWPWEDSADARPHEGNVLRISTDDEAIRLLEKAGALIAAEIDRLLEGRKVKTWSDCEHGFPDGFGCAFRCEEIRAEDADPDAAEQPATGAGLPKLGDDLESFVVMCLSHLLDDGDDKTARELVEMAANELKANYEAGRRAALEEAATKIRERIHDFPKVYQMSDCLVDILDMMKGGEEREAMRAEPTGTKASRDE